MRRIVVLLLVVLASACSEIDLGAPVPAVRAVSVRNGDVIITAPPGFCMDQKLSKLEQGFVVMAGCNIITHGKEFGPLNNAVLVVSVSQDRADAVAGTARLAALVAPDQVIKARFDEGVSLVHLASGGDSYVPGGDPRHWMGVATINGYLVLMSTYSEEGGTAAHDSGGDLILTLAQLIRLHSPKRMLPKPPRLRPF